MHDTRGGNRQGLSEAFRERKDVRDKASQLVIAIGRPTYLREHQRRARFWAIHNNIRCQWPGCHTFGQRAQDRQTHACSIDSEEASAEASRFRVDLRCDQGGVSAWPLALRAGSQCSSCLRALWNAYLQS
jgi:hypothetical protein